MRNDNDGTIARLQTLYILNLRSSAVRLLTNAVTTGPQKSSGSSFPSKQFSTCLDTYYSIDLISKINETG
jgi:hypothetical protein